MTNKQKAAKMFGEFLRESAVLFAVFFPMIWILEKDYQVTAVWIFSVITFSVVLLGVGVWIGVRVE